MFNLWYNNMNLSIFLIRMSKKVIIVEDEPILLKALNIELLGAGFNVLSATAGDSGLELITKEKPDAVLLDLLLPKMNGFEILRRLQENPQLKTIPVIVLSNLGQKDEQKKALGLGAVDYFIKSNTNLDEVVEKLNHFFDHTS